MKKNRAELVATFIIGYVTLLAICLVIYFIFTKAVDLQIFGKMADQSTVLTNLFIWSATLYAPLIFVLLVDNWKNEKKYELRKEFLVIILKNLSKNHYNMLQITGRMKEIYKNKTINSIKKNEIKLFLEKEKIESMSEIYSSINIIKVTQNTDLLHKKIKEYEHYYLAVRDKTKKFMDLNINSIKTFNIIYEKRGENTLYGEVDGSEKITSEVDFEEASKKLVPLYNEIIKIVNKYINQ